MATKAKKTKKLTSKGVHKELANFEASIETLETRRSKILVEMSDAVRKGESIEALAAERAAIPEKIAGIRVAISEKRSLLKIVYESEKVVEFEQAVDKQWAVLEAARAANKKRDVLELEFKDAKKTASSAHATWRRGDERLVEILHSWHVEGQGLHGRGSLTVAIFQAVLEQKDLPHKVRGWGENSRLDPEWTRRDGDE